ELAVRVDGALLEFLAERVARAARLVGLGAVLLPEALDEGLRLRVVLERQEFVELLGGGDARGGPHHPVRVVRSQGGVDQLSPGTGGGGGATAAAAGGEEEQQQEERPALIHDGGAGRETPRAPASGGRCRAGPRSR